MNPAPAQAPTPSAATISAIKSQCPRHWRSLTQLLPVSPYWRLVPATDMRVLITGGSGYLGQFLIQCLSVQHDVAFTYLQNAVSPQQTAAQAFKVNLATGEGLQAAVSEFKPHVVINCAAISQPAACERDYEACKALNVPEHLITALQQLLTQHEQEALLIHISTDQVYDGSRPNWCESSVTAPVNAYGRSKLEAEQHIQREWPGRHVILRCSLIYGPEPPYQPVGRPLYVQFVEQALANGTETSFFTDEYRSAVFVYDICDVIQTIISKYDSQIKQTAAKQSKQQQQQQQQLPARHGGCEQSEPPAAAAAATSPPPPPTAAAASPPTAAAPPPPAPAAAAAAATAASSCMLADLPHAIYNLGGPERLSRFDMAAAVARHCGHSTTAIKAAKSSEVQRGYESPADISMNMQQLLEDMPDIHLTTVCEGLKQIYPQNHSQLDQAV